MGIRTPEHQRKPKYEAVLFDLDGTLIDSAQDLVASVRHALLQVDDRDLPGREDILVLVGKPLEVILRDLGYPCDRRSTNSFVDAYRDYYAKHFRNHTKLYPGVELTLAALKRAGVKQAVVTTKHQAQADLTTRNMGLNRYLDHVHGWQEGRQHKPHPEPVLMAVHALGTQPNHALMVGDSEQDILSAHAAGVDACAVSYGYRPTAFLVGLVPEYIIAMIADLRDIVLA